MKLKMLAMLVVASFMLPATAQELVLGLSYPKTGRYSTISATEVAVDIAVAEINAAGGVNGRKIRLDKFDTASDAKNAQIAVQRFAEDVKALAIIGPYSSQEAQVAFATSERLEIVQIPNSATAPGLTKEMKWAWRVIEDEGKQFARLLKTLESKKLVKQKTAVVIYPSDEFVGKALSAWMPKLLEANGWKQVIPPEAYLTEAADLAPHITKLKGRSPSVIAFAGLPAGAAKVMREVRRQGHQSIIIGSQVMADPDVVKLLGADGEGTMYVSWYWWDANERTRAFEKKFLDETKKRGIVKAGAHHVDASAYDIVYVLADAMKRAGVTGDPAKLKAERNAIREALAKTSLAGVSGNICFARDHDAELAAYIIRVRNGKRILVDSHPSDKCN
ncbi:MAG: ABC transporter substrate-binding protein [Betaproteobacteria bacterium]|nr:ABC transporter substrate-binding protein [Betaproteobacteria bacterium]